MPVVRKSCATLCEPSWHELPAHVPSLVCNLPLHTVCNCRLLPVHGWSDGHPDPHEKAICIHRILRDRAKRSGICGLRILLSGVTAVIATRVGFRRERLCEEQHGKKLHALVWICRHNLQIFPTVLRCARKPCARIVIYV